MFIAHINNNNDVQSCRDHSLGCAEIAKKRLENIGLGNTAFIAGILHDAGKLTIEFNNYIVNAHAGKSVVKGSVIHTFAGCSYVLKNYHKGKLDYNDVAAEIIAYAIAGHHGLFDCINSDGDSGFDHRVDKQKEYDKRAMVNFFHDVESDTKINELFSCSALEIEQVLKDKLPENSEEALFYMGLLSRLILSAVIDGDRQDTYDFMSGVAERSDKQADWAKCIEQVEKYIYEINKDKTETAIQKARQELSAICKDFAANPGDTYKIKLPTGAGKTLSGLRYALHHAQKYGKKRIFYIAPLISILEQNAKVIREAVNDNNIVLEHHSNVINEMEGTQAEEEQGTELAFHRILTENWNSPIVVTTLVQFLNTLFGGKTSQIRRFASMSDSVIILDEVQTVPWKMLSLFNIAINFLKDVCNTTILLCSATQPTFDELPHKMMISNKKLLSEDEEIAYGRIFRRSEIVFDGNYKLEELPEYIKSRADENKSLLVVCNKKTQSEYLFTALQQTLDYVFHLSAAMCMAHRENVLAEVKEYLKEERKVICISTQVIEAGVDISFESVIRFETGLDSIVQSNGRCNRNGELEKTAITHIIRCTDEDLTHLKEIRQAKEATTSLLEAFKSDRKKYDNDLSSEKSVLYYYKRLYSSFRDNTTLYACEINGTHTSLFELLSTNYIYRSRNNNRSEYLLNQAFKKAGDEFKALDTDTLTVLVPYGEGKQVIADLCSERAKRDICFTKEVLNKAKRFTVSIMAYQAEALRNKGAIYDVFEKSISVLKEPYYNDYTGIMNGKERQSECSTLIL